MCSRTWLWAVFIGLCVYTGLGDGVTWAAGVSEKASLFVGEFRYVEQETLRRERENRVEEILDTFNWLKRPLLKAFGG